MWLQRLHLVSLFSMVIACNPAGSDLTEADRLRGENKLSEADTKYAAIIETYPDTPEAEAASTARCEIATDGLTSGWKAAIPAVKHATDDDMGRGKMLSASAEVGMRVDGATRACGKSPDSYGCTQGSSMIRESRSKWAKALLGWLDAGAAEAADNATSTAMSGDPLSMTTKEWAAKLGDARREAATTWTRTAIGGLDAEYSEPPFNVTATDPDPVKVGKKVETPPPSVQKAIAKVDEVRTICGK